MFLDLQNITVGYYQDLMVLQDVSLQAREERITTIIGPNGAGKSTVLKTAFGFLKPMNGKILLNEKDIAGQKPFTMPLEGMVFIMQDRGIFPFLTVEENLRLALPARRARTGTVPDLIYDLFPVLADMRQRRGGDLSGGQQQQLAIGRALVLEPKLLILDEPCEGIQPNVVREIGNVITRLNHELGIAILLVEQKLPVARRVAEQFSIMDKGRVVAEGEMMRLDDALIAEYLTV